MSLFSRFRKGSWQWRLARIQIVGRDLPEVHECYGGHDSKAAKLLYGDVKECPQCDGKHRHEWVDCLVLNGVYPEVATRCRICGGRKCDRSSCSARRHHRDAHTFANGRVEKVGG